MSREIVGLHIGKFTYYIWLLYFDGYPSFYSSSLNQQIEIGDRNFNLLSVQRYAIHVLGGRHSAPHSVELRYGIQPATLD